MKSDPIPRDVRSRASLFGHPLHPMVIPFPIAFLIGTLACDIAFATTGDLFWPRAAYWALIAALVMGAVAGVLGAIDFSTIRAARTAGGWTHALGNGLAMTLSLVNLISRMDGAPPGTGALILSVLVVGILAVTGWLGGELVFRHKIGTTP